MATILVVDDHPTNREFLVTLLGYRGHYLLQAADGAEALEVARAEHPDLVISDILMPTMDGYEFVRQLRTDPDLGHLPVIFSTAHYLDQEASALARQCGVPFILPKPSEPETILRMVDAALGLTSSPITPPVEEAFDRDHLRLMTNQLVHKAAELQGLNDKLAALLDLGRHLVSERDPQYLLDVYCRGAREIIGAKWTAVGILGDDQATVDQLFVNGLDDSVIAPMAALKANQGVLGVVVAERRPCRLQNVSGEPHLVGLPSHLPPVYSFLSVPIGYQTQIFGWLCLGNRLGSDAFSEVDERLAVTLAAQMAVAHESARLFSNVQRQAAELAQEVAERKRSEEVLRSSEQRYRDLIEGSIQGITIYRNLTPLLVNRAFADIFGYTPEEILAMRTMTLLFAPQEHDRLQRSDDARRRGEDVPHQYEFQGLRKDGSTLWLETIIRTIVWEGEPATQATVLDITARKRAEAEREQLQAQLFEAQKMEAIGTLASRIAHDFNNILGIMLGYTELTLGEVADTSMAHTRLLKILNAGKRARDLVRQILTFSRKTDQQRRPTQLDSIIEEALMLLRAMLPATIDIRSHIETTVRAVRADPTQMNQVLMNLCANAAHAMREAGGVLEVRFEGVEVTATFPTPHPRLPPGPYARLIIHDTGHGMESDILEHIFEPFFTTKEVGEGTGLGLAVVHGIVANHGGAIMVTSTPGQGTTFTIYLPCVDDAPVEGLPEISVVRGHERILFVDDEEALARWGQLALEPLGYHVVTCTSSTEALTIFRKSPQAFDLLITDQIMPGLTSDVLAREVWRIRPELPIILCTGTSTTMTQRQAERLGPRAYLVKPVLQQDLSRAIRQVLDRRRAREI